MCEENINMEQAETKKKKVDLNDAVGAATLVAGGMAVYKFGSWLGAKARPKLKAFAGKVANAGTSQTADSGDAGSEDVSD